ncbi:MAG: hypothetical protein ACXVBU_18650, partial [Ktedonobacteraceae bacterium]
MSLLFLGIAVAWIISTKNTYLIALAIGTGLLAGAGIYGYALSITTHDDAVVNAHCAQINYCHVGGVETTLLNLAFLIGGDENDIVDHRGRAEGHLPRIGVHRLIGNA